MPTGFDPRRFDTAGLRRYMGKNRLYPFFSYGGPSLDVTVWDDDFLGDTLHGGYGSVATGGSAAIPADTLNGVLRLTSGGTDDNHVGIPLGERNFQGDLNPVLLARVKVDTITSVKMEIGFTDSEGDAGAVNDLDAVTHTATDCAVWAVDTDDDDKWQAISKGSSLTPVPTKIEPGYSIVAATYDWLCVAIEGNVVHFWHKLGTKGWVDDGYIVDGIEGGNNILPWIFVQARSDATRLMDVDRLIAFQDRE